MSRPSGCVGFASQGVKVALGLFRLQDVFINRDVCGSHGADCERLSAASLSGLPAQVLPKSSRDIISKQPSWKSCALVGNSGTLLEAQRGPEIDSHDIVVRFNEAPTKGFETSVGNKTTHRILNSVWAKGYADSRSVPVGFRFQQGYHPLERGVTLVANACIPARYCTMPGEYRRLHEHMANLTRPDVTVAYTSKRIVGSANRLLAIYSSCRWGRASHNQRAPAPTTGLAATMMLLKLCKRVRLYGMGGRSSQAGYHYFDQGHGTLVKKGFRSHSFQLEADLLRDLMHKGYLQLCHPAACYG